MNLLSIRRHWDSRYLFGDVQYRTASGATYEGDAALSQLFSSTHGQRTLFLIHGYNVDAAAVIAAYQKVEHEIGSLYDVVIGFLWPGFDALGFVPAILSANHAGMVLRDLLMPLHPASIAIETHSLGARVALRALCGIHAQEVILTSPAVPDDCLSAGKEFEYASADVIHVCYSKNDPVLGRWYRAFEKALALLLLSHGDTALGLNGPTGKYPSWIDAEDFTDEIRTHGGWNACPQYFACWKQWEGANMPNEKKQPKPLPVPQPTPEPQEHVEPPPGPPSGGGTE